MQHTSKALLILILTISGNVYNFKLRNTAQHPDASHFNPIKPVSFTLSLDDLPESRWTGLFDLKCKYLADYVSSQIPVISEG